MTLTKEQLDTLRDRCDRIITGARSRYEPNSPDGILGTQKVSSDESDSHD